MGFMAMVAPPMPDGIMAQPCGRELREDGEDQTSLGGSWSELADCLLLT